jgi:outer membrane lipoprotein-sorting protein
MNKSITIALIIFSTSIFAQNQVAKKVLDKLSATTRSYENISVEFDFILENKSQNVKEIQQGTLVLAGDKFQLTMDSQTIINNGEIQWIYLAEMNEVQIMKYDPEESMMSPNKLFTIYEEGYKYAYIGAESRIGKRLQIIDLFPKDIREFIKINIAVDAAKNQLERITIHDKNGGTYTYLIKSFRSNTAIKPFIFNIANFPSIEVIDLR